MEDSQDHKINCYFNNKKLFERRLRRQQRRNKRKITEDSKLLPTHLKLKIPKYTYLDN